MKKIELLNDHFTPEYRARLNALYAEQERLRPMLDAMLLEAQNQRLQEGHKARESTLDSIKKAQASDDPSRAPK